MTNFEDRVLIDEFGGGVIAIISKGRLVAYGLGYSDERTISDITGKSRRNELVDETGQLYFDFMRNRC